MGLQLEGSKRIVVVGSINIDLVARVEHLPRPGETVLASDVRYIPGGKGANQAVAIAKLGGSSIMIGRVGDDPFADRLVQSLSSHGVDASNVAVTRDCSSGIALIGVEQSGENSITIASGANGRLSPDDVRHRESTIASADALLVQLEIPVETVAEALDIAKRHGVATVLDPAPAPSQPLPQSLLEVDIISPNQTEAECLTGIAVKTMEQAREAASKLRELGARNVVLKLGQQGALVLDSNHLVTHVPAPQVEVIDTTAAGDAFTAALTLAMTSGQPLVEAVRFACAAGSVAVTKLGAQQAMPSHEDVAAKLENTETLKH